MSSRLIRHMWEPVMQAAHSLPCVGMAEAPSLLMRRTHGHGAHSLPGDMRQLGRKLVPCAARDLKSPVKRDFSTGTSAQSAFHGRQCGAPSAGHLVQRGGAVQRWLHHGQWGSRTGLRHAGSQSNSGESTPEHYGLRRSVRVAANGEAGFVKGAGVVSHPPFYRLMERDLCTCPNHSLTCI